MYSYKHPRPVNTGDMIIPNEQGDILLIKRKNPPFQGQYALPGGFLEVDRETMEHCAMREAEEETGLKVEIDRLVGIYSHPKRDPRAHSITAAYLAKPVSHEEAAQARAADDATDLLWIHPKSDKYQAIDLAFDHARIVADAFGLPCSFSYPNI